ncbi:hypothetical protein VTH06DRAFT_665 [Thermothelomyces fergusii]
MSRKNDGEEDAHSRHWRPTEAEREHEEVHDNHGEASDDLSSDSDDDPFKYDRDSFAVFLQPSRERETSNVEYDWASGDAPNEVRISVRPPVAPPNSPVVLASGVEDSVERPGGGHGRKEMSTLMSDGADWETVATSVGQFDSNRALASSSGLSGSHLVKVTGSSIADYSDTNRTAPGHNRVTSHGSRSPLSCGCSVLSRTFDPMADSAPEQGAFPDGKQSVFRARPRLVARGRGSNTSRSATATRTMAADLHRIATPATEATRGRAGTTNIGFRSGHYYPPGSRRTGADDYFFPADGVNEEAHLSWEARRRRRVYYCAMCVLSALPFFAPLVYRGTFDPALSWYTRGEIGCLTRRQRRNVLVVGVAFAGLWLVVLAIFVTIVVSRRVGG